jgi:hypothetical protein
MGQIFVAKLKENMLELDSEPMVIENLPQKGLKEGPWVFERNGIYYLTFPHVENRIERLEYAIGNSPVGPFKMTGVIMDESPTGCWTNHHSIVEYNQQWYLFYHHNDYSPKFDKNRSIRVDSLFFNADGTIQNVKPTLRGVGLSSAEQPIEIDRYSAMSESGASIAFIDSSNVFKGWKTLLSQQAAWVQYNKVESTGKKLKTIKVKALSESGGTLQVRLNSPQGAVVSEIVVPPSNTWQVIDTRIAGLKPGIYDLVVLLNDGGAVEVDWIQFAK